MSQGRRILSGAILAATGALAAPGVASAAITATDAAVREADADTTVDVTLTRTVELVALPTTVQVTSADQTATAPADYRAVDSEVSFSTGLLGEVQTRTVTVTIVGDDVHEPVEAFRLLLSGAEVGEPDAAVLVGDDDPAPAAPAPPPPPPPAPAPPAPTPVGVGPPRLQRPSTALVTVACPLTSVRCAGTMTLRSRPERRARTRALRRERLLARRAFTLAGGGQRTMRIRLRSEDRRLLRRVRRLKVRATVTATDAAGRRTTSRRNGTLVGRLRFTG